MVQKFLNKLPFELIFFEFVNPSLSKFSKKMISSGDPEDVSLLILRKVEPSQNNSTFCSWTRMSHTLVIKIDDGYLRRRFFIVEK